MNYTILRESTNRKLKKKITLDGFLMKPKMRARESFIEVKEIEILNQDLKENVLKMQFHLAYKRIFKLVMNILESDASEGDVALALSEIERMKQILKDKYLQEVSKNEYRSMLRKVDILESNLKEKVLVQQRMNEMIWNMMHVPQEDLEEKKGRGR